MLAIVREVAGLSGGCVDENQIGCVNVFVVVRMRDDDGERSAIGRDLWIGDAKDFADPGEVEDFARRSGDGRTGRGCCCRWALTGNARIEDKGCRKKTGQKTFHGIAP